MSIDPEQLLALAKSRLHDGGVTLGWPTVVKIVESLRERETAAQRMQAARDEELVRDVEAWRAQAASIISLTCWDEHPDDQAVDRFSAAMKAKLADARAKGRDGWNDPDLCSASFLAELLVGHIGKGNTGNLEDVANLAMMLHQRGEDPDVVARAAARRDALMKAEELERIAREADDNPPAFIEAGCLAIDSLEQEAERLRRQAEEAPCPTSSPASESES